MLPNASRFTCAHETLTIDHPQSAKSDLNKKRVLGVRWKRWLGGSYN